MHPFMKTYVKLHWVGGRVDPRTYDEEKSLHVRTASNGDFLAVKHVSKFAKSGY